MFDNIMCMVNNKNRGRKFFTTLVFLKKKRTKARFLSLKIAK
jgi:hypothetical protein